MGLSAFLNPQTSLGPSVSLPENNLEKLGGGGGAWEPRAPGEALLCQMSSCQDLFRSMGPRGKEGELEDPSCEELKYSLSPNPSNSSLSSFLSTLLPEIKGNTFPGL